MTGEFWNTQPVGIGGGSGFIAAPVEASTMRIKLPPGLKWVEPCSIPEIVGFLRDNYVEDLDSSFRLSYSVEFFKFLFSNPAHLSCFSLGVANDQEMIGYLMAKRHDLYVGGQNISAMSINFLCLSKGYRGSRLSPLLIKEATRIANTAGIYQGIFTGQRDYGFSITSVLYHHLPLDSQRLQALGYLDESYLDTRNYKLRKMTTVASERDMPAIYDIYVLEASRYSLCERFTPENLKYALVSRKNVMYTIYNPCFNEFASAFIIDTYCIQSGSSFKAAYLYYWSGSTDIIEDLIYLLKRDDIALLNVLDLGSNNKLIKRFEMLEGTGCLKYHLFNWKEEHIRPENLNFILF